MKVLLAGASGAIGAPLTRMLIEAGHEVLGLSRSEASGRRLRELGATPLLADAMDREALLRAVRGQSADAVIHELTALKRPPSRHKDLFGTDKLRVAGTANLLAAARELGATRFVTQSIVYGYGYRDHGTRPLTEANPFGELDGSAFDAHVRAMVSTEQQAFEAPGIEGVALRYGGFYGPGAGTEAVGKLLRRRAFPVPRNGGGYLPWIYLDDAASATVAALEKGRAGQAYNIVDEQPVRIGDFLDELAVAYRAPKPMRVPDALLRVMPYAHTFVNMSMRVSTDKARRELGWQPAVRTYRDGIGLIAEAMRG
ncbi:NAD-dependent epimerase/dehydratase family protein [Rugosimonospora africana]|uniref:NAD-dependent dehydratase n=1 Tax=Rugosimonospora africana TaxID=556532 RepID=A0A8J3QP30_9ACTN|nr:NAD(P)-dependent oxidoreductase [Rugosimonospora africana]GIH13577.1 NAD-dependent dehydratase [Rugosimonospora africana]